ncbi:MAG TPA: methyltransferase domain-containing protein [Vicinamibacteria bacterium]|nr:methyltransferase domain-containing protein [Vicinamibacteria bacterium]
MSRWGHPETVAGFSRAMPNATLLGFVEKEKRRMARPAVLDLGCGAGRNAVPMAALGCDVLGTDNEWPMLEAAAGRARAEGVAARTRFVLAPMDRLPVSGRSFDVIVAHGIWNLAASSAEFRRAVAEAARAGRPAAALFLFTFSRNTLAPSAAPVAGEPFVFTEFAAEPQCFLTEDQLLSEMAAAGFEALRPLTEHNRPRPGQLNPGGPVIYEGTFRLRP